MTKVSIVIPSMNRPERLLACVTRALCTTAAHNVEVIAVIDCDTASRDLLANLGDDRVRVLFNEQRRGAIACWNQGLAAARGDVLVFGNDDCHWGDGWLDAALVAHREQLGGYGLVGFNDGYQDGTVLAVQYLFDRPFCIDHLGGVMAYPVYEFYYNDSEANARAKRAGRFVWCREAMVQHHHWTRPGQNHKDSLDAENEPKARRDGALFAQRERDGFPDTFERVLPRPEPDAHLRILVLSDTRLPTAAAYPGHGLGKGTLTLADGLRARGHEVHLWAGAGSVFDGELRIFGSEAEMAGADLSGFDAIIDGGHEHQAGRRFPGLPIINFSQDREYAPGANAVFPSEAHRAYHNQPGRIVKYGIDVDAFPLYEGPREDYLAWLAHPYAHKGPLAAVQAARLAGSPLQMAGTGTMPPGAVALGPLSGADKTAFLAHARALLVPASIESGGLTCLEAAACGTPVIAFGLGSLPEYVCDGVTGFVVEDIESMAAAVARTGEIDPAQARAWIVEHHSQARMVDGYEQAARDVARGERW